MYVKSRVISQRTPKNITRTVKLFINGRQEPQIIQIVSLQHGPYRSKSCNIVTRNLFAYYSSSHSSIQMGFSLIFWLPGRAPSTTTHAKFSPVEALWQWH